MTLRARQHIPSHLAERLGQHVATKSLNAVVFNLPSKFDMADMIRDDVLVARMTWLSEAKGDLDEYARRERGDFLASKNGQGEQLDFHALRHTCGAWLMLADVNIKTVQAVMRHSTITLTMDTYGHLMPGAESQAVANVEAMINPVNHRLSATGTNMRYPQKYPQSMHEALPSNATPCRETDEHSGQKENPQVVKLAGVSDSSRSNATKIELRAQGLEPWTYGLKVRCSTN